MQLRCDKMMPGVRKAARLLESTNRKYKKKTNRQMKEMSIVIDFFYREHTLI